VSPINAVLVLVVALTTSGPRSFFPPSLKLDVSQKALERAVRVERPDAGVEDGARLLKDFEWVLVAMKEKPLWSRHGPRAYRMLAMLHRSILVLRLERSGGGGPELVAKRYDQGSRTEGVGLSASRTLDLNESSYRELVSAFVQTGVPDKTGFRENATYRDGWFDPLSGVFLFEYAGEGAYGLAVFEPPLTGSGLEGDAAARFVERALTLIGVDFLSPSQRGEYVESQ